MSALVPLDPQARQRLLALMGIDVYTRRAPARARAAQPAAAAPARSRSAVAPTIGVFQVACDPAEAGREPLAGRYGALLKHILSAVGVEPSHARFVEPGGTHPGPRIAFHAGAAGDELQAPPLAQLRESAEAKRALWQVLRPLRRRLGQA